jgi:uncharacterized protein (DUF952 family)
VEVRIFHIVDRGTWAAATQAGHYVPVGFERDGFVHLSFADQVAGVANARYRREPDPIVVEIESDQVAEQLRVEDSYQTGEVFPHVYGPIPIRATVGVHEMTRADDGHWVFNPDAAVGLSSTDR